MRALAAVVLLPLLLLLTGCGAPSRHGSDHLPRLVLRPEVGAAQVLAGWDRRRAAAWAAGSVRELRALYVPGSRTATADVRMLRAWRARGLAVSGLATQLLAVEILHRSAGRLRLRVTDRVVRAVATGPGVSRALPRDLPTTYVVVLVRRGGDWLVDEAVRG